jgi:hypothetical protein
LCKALTIPISGIFKIGQDYGCLNMLESSDSGYRVKLLNFTPQNALFGAENSEPELTLAR